MTLKDINLKVSYDSSVDNILNDFYIPVLSQSLKYSRITGFFSSSALAVAAKGVTSLILNGGSMRIISGAKLSKEDLEEIAKGYQIKDIITKSFIRDIENLHDQLIKDHVKALGWMIQNNKLDIRIAIPLDSHNNPIDEDRINQRGIFHQKIGILEDDYGNIISFSGSINESAMAWKYNVEEFKVFRNWIDGESEHLKSDLDKFKNFWGNNIKNVLVYDVPHAIKEKIISISPKNFEELKYRLEKYHISPIKLRHYQLEAIEAWLKNKKGLIEMATGTGKTYVSIACIQEILKDEEKLVVVITCPFIHLIDQWQKNLGQWQFISIAIHGSAKNWEHNLKNKIYEINNNYKQTLIILTTHNTFSSEKFVNLLKNVKCQIMLIADEVHGLGSIVRRIGLQEKYIYRIGLSATPFRWFDEEGTEIILKYFGDIVFKFEIKKAIPDYLTPYQYHLFIVELSSLELREYMNLTKKIAREYYSSRSESEQTKLLESLLIKRQKIIVNAEAKYNTLLVILNSFNNLTNCLIYCSPNQIIRVQAMLNSKSIVQHKFTAYESKEERKKILDMFELGNYQVLVAMKCLDEGVDVPATKAAIIMASSTNPREFIQRRGRILRKHPNKKKALVYDILVVASLQPNLDEDIYKIEKKILLKELKRIVEFGSSAENYIEILNRIYPLLRSYKISLGEINNGNF